jgi:hypothetical protein
VTVDFRADAVRQTAILIRLSYRRGLQLDDRSPDAKPDKLPVALTALEHLIGSSGCHDLSILFMLTDE